MAFGDQDLQAFGAGDAPAVLPFGEGDHNAFGTDDEPVFPGQPAPATAAAPAPVLAAPQFPDAITAPPGPAAPPSPPNLPRPGEPESTAWETFIATFKSVPEMGKQAFGGFVQSLPSQMPPPDPLTFVLAPKAYEAAEKERAAALRGVQTRMGKWAGKVANEAAASLRANHPNVDPESLKGYAFDIGQNMLRMVPAVGVSLATKSPSAGLSIMGVEVYGRSYNEAITEGRTPAEAQMDAVFNTLAETIPERIPLGILMKPGSKFVPRILKAMGAEALQEQVTEALQIGYDMRVLDKDMTWGQALQRMKRAGIVGAGVGGSLAAAAHPFTGTPPLATMPVPEIQGPPLPPGAQPAETVIGAEFGGTDAPAFEPAPTPAPAPVPVPEAEALRQKADELEARAAAVAESQAEGAAELADIEAGVAEVEAEAAPTDAKTDADVTAAASEAATSPLNEKPEPTEAQKEAGNYAKGHVFVHGLDISIENPQGSTRSGKDQDGKPWSVEMPAHYGYVKRTEGADGDHVDVYVGPTPLAPTVFVVDQIDPDTGKFDEHKVMLGFESNADALATYDAGFSDGRGPERRGAVTPMMVDDFKTWLREGDTTKAMAYTETAAEFGAADEPAALEPEPSVRGKRAAQPKGPVDMLRFLATRGGIRDDEGHDLARGRDGQRFVPGAGQLIRPTGMSIDAAGEALYEAGYFGPPETTDRPTEADVLDKLDTALQGKRPVVIPEEQFVEPTTSEVEAENDVQIAKAVADLGAELDETELAVVKEKLAEGLELADAVEAAAIQAEANVVGEYLDITPSEKDAPFDAPTPAEAEPVAGRDRDVVAPEGAAETRPAGPAQEDAAQREERGGPGEAPEEVVAAPVTEPAERPTIAPEPVEEPEDGLQGTVPPSDERPRAADVEQPAPKRDAGAPPETEVGGGAPDVPRTDQGRPEAPERGPDVGAPEVGRGAGEGDVDRVPGGRDADSGVKGENFFIEPGALDEARGAAQKARDNVRAIELVHQIEAEGRPATKAEQEDLARYVGWGGLKGAFPDADGNFGKGFEKVGARLRDLLTDTEYATARRSIQYAHYTSETVVRSMWGAVTKLGFKGGKVFEPGMGVGNFAGMMPADVAQNTDYSGLELDHITARIARLLYPQWGVRQDNFTKAPLPLDTFDLVIGNPPFADVAIQSDPEYPQKFLLHDYFFAKSLDSVRPGGLLAFISSAGTMNKQDSKARNYLADRADFVGGVRLPANAFERNAGTSVTTDIIILRKRLPDEAAGDRAWTSTVQATLPDFEGKPTKGQVNRYFYDNPEMVLGEEGFFDKLYKGRYAVRAPKGFDLKAGLAKAFATLPDDVMSEWESTIDHAEIDFATAEHKEGSFYRGRDGRLMQQRRGVGQPVQRRGKGVTGGKTGPEIERIEALIPLRDALRAVYTADLAEDTANATKARERMNTAYDAFVAKYGPINKAEFQYRRPNVIMQESARAEAREEARYIGEPFVEGTFDPSGMIRAGDTLGKIAKARKDAREAAQRANRSFDEGTFNPDDMTDVVTDKRPNIGPFMDDPESYRLRAIEIFDDQAGTAEKSDVFFENIITRERVPEITSVDDALLYVLNTKGRLDIEAVAEAAGVSPTVAIDDLGDSIYLEPGTENTWSTRDAYLSGDVRKKLRQAKAVLARNPSFQRNVDGLESVQPTPLAPSEINANLGMPWIPTETIEAFGLDLGLASLDVKYVGALGQWFASGDTASPAAITTWGTLDRAAPALIQDALNRQNPRIYVRGDDGKPVLDTVATQAAQEKVGEIKERFSDWVWAEQGRADPLAQLYNEEYNNLVVRDFNGDHLTTPGISAAWAWRPHQTRVIARIIQEGNTYMAHAVGAGKTSAMIGAGMEMRRLGLVRKPMYVVPNHMLGQFAKEFYEQYPTARISVADERRFHTDRRKQFIADVANEDLDAVIITHSAFGMIPISNSFQDHLVNQQLDLYRDLLGQVKAEGGDSRITRSRLEKQIERLEQRLSSNSMTQKDQVFTFEEMGVDFLFVDEAQEFRKLDFATKMTSVKGISPEGSKKAWDLYAKTRYLETINPNRNLVLASGTSVTNTMAELFTVSRYLQSAELEQRGLGHFDSWAGAFGDTVTQLEQDPAGGYKSVTRFAKFVNVPELSAMVRQTMDVVTSRQLEQYVTRPAIKGGKRQMNLAEKTPELEAYQEGLAKRMKEIAARKGKAKPGDDIILSVIGDGRHAAIDMRLAGGAASSQPSKLDLLVANLHQIWADTKRQPFHAPAAEGYSDKPIDTGPATQMVFANLGISGTRGMAVHKYIATELSRRGVPKDQIALISDHKTHVAKQRLFNDVNEGKVRILIGSTAKMGTGVNAQRRLYALHNLDPLWFPAEDEQRNGRGLRQGNMNPEIEIHDYSTKGTYDSTMWGLMETKARFIQAFFEGDPTLRDMEDLGEASQYEQAKAITTNDPRLIELTDLRQKLERARRRQLGFEREQSRIKRGVASSKHDIDYYEKRIANIGVDIEQRQDVSGDDFTAEAYGTVHEDRVEFGDAILGALDNLIASAEGEKLSAQKLGSIGGFDIMADTWKPQNKIAEGAVYLQRTDHETDVKVTGSARGSVQSMEGILRGFESELSDARSRLDAARKTVADFEPQMGKTFTGQPEIDDLAARVKALEKELAGEAEDEQGAQETDEDERLALPRDRTGSRPFDPVALRNRLADLGMADKVALTVVERIGRSDRAEGRYINRTINVAIDAADGNWTLNHEAVHALRDMGLIKPGEWRTLAAMARADTPRLDEVRERYAGQPLNDEQLIEEAVADTFADWAGDRAKVAGPIRDLFNRIRVFLQKLGNALKGEGFTSAEQVMGRIESGEVGRRPRPGGPQESQERLSLSPDTRDTAGARQAALQGFLAKGQPIDRAMRVPFDWFGGVDAKGEWQPGAKMFDKAKKVITEHKFSPEGQFSWLNNAMEAARYGLIDRYGLTEEYVTRERKRDLDARAIAVEGADILKTLAEQNVSIEEAKVLQAILTGEDVADADMARLALPIRRAVDELGAEAVSLGLVSPESYERNRGSYLHRVYMKHEINQPHLSRWATAFMTKKRKKILGDALKGRGIFLEIERGRMMRDIPSFREGARGVPQAGERFTVLDKYAAQEELPDIGAGPAKIERRVYWPAEDAVPARFAEFTNKGDWEVRGAKGKKIVLWRDYTKTERESMGEITDARYTIGKTFMLMANDLATGRFYKDISENEEWSRTDQPNGKWVDAADFNRLWHDETIEWVRVPATVIPKTGGKKRWGALANRWVRPEIWRDLNEIDTMGRPNMWTKLLTQWKLNKTARSPVVHMNNIMSNFVFMDLADVRLQDLVRGIRAYATSSADFEEAAAHGAFGADLISQEVRREVLMPILEELERNMAGTNNPALSRFGALGRIAEAIWSKAKMVDRKMVDMYRLEDEIFRMGMYMRRRALGESAEDAALEARQQFLDYDIRAPWVNTARRTVLPFIAYSYRAAPLIARSVATRPWKLAKYFLLAYAANTLAYMIAPGDEEEERRSIRDTERGYTWIGVPRMMRMPYRDEFGNPVFLDIRRWIPAGDVFDLSQGHGAFSMPAPLQFGGPLMLGMELAFNKSAFTGDPITNELTDTDTERAGKIADHLWKSWMPSAAWIPGSWYWRKIGLSMRGAVDSTGRPYPLPEAVASSFGIKLKPQDVQQNLMWRRRELDKARRGLNYEQRRLGRLRDRNVLSEESYLEGLGVIDAKRRNIDAREERLFPPR